MQAGYAKSELESDAGLAITANYQDWTRFTMRAFVSYAHGGRFVHNYGNRKAGSYGRFENAGAQPAGRAGQGQLPGAQTARSSPARCS